MGLSSQNYRHSSEAHQNLCCSGLPEVFQSHWMLEEEGGVCGSQSQAELLLSSCWVWGPVLSKVSGATVILKTLSQNLQTKQGSPPRPGSPGSEERVRGLRAGLRIRLLAQLWPQHPEKPWTAHSASLSQTQQPCL